MNRENKGLAFKSPKCVTNKWFKKPIWTPQIFRSLESPILYCIYIYISSKGWLTVNYKFKIYNFRMRFILNNRVLFEILFEIIIILSIFCDTVWYMWDKNIKKNKLKNIIGYILLKKILWYIFPWVLERWRR